VNRLEPRVIEGAIQIVDSVSSDESDLVETRFVKSMSESLGSVLRVNFNNSSIGLFKSVDAPFDISDGYIGPFDLSYGFQEVNAGILSDDCWVARTSGCAQDGGYTCATFSGLLLAQYVSCQNLSQGWGNNTLYLRRDPHFQSNTYGAAAKD
jgi:hypothetical protein